MSQPDFAGLCVSLLAEGRTVRFRASGHSMAPAVRDGDLLTVAARKAEALEPGEIAFYRAGRGLVAHRVMARVGGGLVCRGDAPSCAEERIAGKDVLGVVIAVRPARHRWLTACRRRIGARLRCLVPRPLAPGRGREKTGP